MRIRQPRKCARHGNTLPCPFCFIVSKRRR